MASTIVLVTDSGANSGIGFAISKVLVCTSKRFHVIMACRSLKKADAAKAEIESADLKGTLSTLQLDVTDKKSIEDAVTHVQDHFGHVDAVINNAGVGGLKLDVRTSFELLLEVNVLGPAMVAAAFRPLLLKSSNPYSIYMGSGPRTLVRNALEIPQGLPNQRGPHAYQVSKAALNMLAVLELRDYKDEGLKVFVVSPGFLRSNIRGTSEEEINGWGGAKPADEAGELILDILHGKRDADIGCLVHKDGVYPWG